MKRIITMIKPHDGGYVVAGTDFRGTRFLYTTKDFIQAVNCL